MFFHASSDVHISFGINSLVSLLAFASSVDWRLSSNVLSNNRLQNDQAWVGPLVTAEQFKAWYEVDEVIYADEVAAFATRAGKTIHVLHGIEPIPTVPCTPHPLRPGAAPYAPFRWLSVHVKRDLADPSVHTCACAGIVCRPQHRFRVADRDHRVLRRHRVSHCRQAHPVSPVCGLPGL